MRAPESVAVEITGTAAKWSGRVIAIGAPGPVETAAREAAAAMKPGSGVVSIYGLPGWSDSGSRAEHGRIVEARERAAGSQPAAIENRIAATTAAADARDSDLAKAEADAAAMVAKAKAAKDQADKAVNAAQAVKPAPPAKKAAAAKKAAKKAAKRSK